MLLYSDDFQAATKIERIAESLISENANEHSLRARLTQFTINIKVFAESVQMNAECLRMAYQSAKIAGDVDNACLIGLMYGIAASYCSPDLLQLQKVLANFMYEMVCAFCLVIIFLLFLLPYLHLKIPLFTLQG